MAARAVLALLAAALVAAPSAAAADGVVRDGNARFQVICPALIRLEYAADGRFEDRPTMLGGEPLGARAALQRPRSRAAGA